MSDAVTYKYLLAANTVCARYFERVDFVEPHGNGHINDTFRVCGDRGECVLQRINPNVFKRPDWVMDNIVMVTDYLRARLDERGNAEEREALSLLRTLDGECYVTDADGAVWRLYPYIGGSRSYDVAPDALTVERAAACFGRFARLLADFPAQKLRVTIRDFHNTAARVKALEMAARQDVCDRLDGARRILDGYLDRAHLGEQFAAACGALRQRVVHNDTKLSNVLFDRATGEGLCVIDLDTVMTGYIACDFGDGIRSCAATDGEDAATAGLHPERYEAFTRGYLSALGGELTRDEFNALVPGALAMTYECGVRFLTDYLMGDVYFKTAYDRHNLARATNQLSLLCDMEARRREMEETARRLYFS
ncbi:MAG: aminoglycoside phosphotransferase family protein [Clostridia bacterium]|nr:aminoglycoside phosphotransferase family protein [Clostridia bacterium]